MAKLRYLALCFSLFLAFVHFEATANARSTINFEDEKVAPSNTEIALGRRMMQDPSPPEGDCVSKPCNDEGICEYEGCVCITQYEPDESPHCIIDYGSDTDRDENLSDYGSDPEPSEDFSYYGSDPRAI